jgi:hypothetical protein
LSTGWIIEVENRSLGVVIGRALAHGMKRISFQLNGAAVECGGEKRDCSTSARLGSCEGKFFAGNNPLGGLGEWDEVSLRATAP